MRRSKKPALRLVSWQPAEAVLLGVDPGRASGAALVCDRKLVRVWEEVCSRQQRYDVVDFAFDEASERGLPLVAAVESWSPHGRWGFDAAMGLAESAGRWLDAIEHAIGPVPERDLVLRVESQEWRRAVLGGGPNKPTAEWKTLAQGFVAQRFGADLGSDAAEAVCIALWAQHSPRVSEALRRADLAASRRSHAAERIAGASP